MENTGSELVVKKDTNNKPAKKTREYDIGCVPGHFWYTVVGANMICPVVSLLANIKVKPDQDYLKEEGPIVVLGNHPSYLDPIIMERLTHGRPLNFVTGEFLFRSKAWNHIFKSGGAIPKKQFVVDTLAVKSMMKVLKRNGVIGVFPEGTRFIDGKSIGFDDGIAKLIKKVNASIYVMRTHGAYLTFPRWSKSGGRRGKITAEFEYKLKSSEVEKMSVEEVHQFILKALDYNENDYARENNPSHKSRELASGLQNVAYACPRCKSEFTMTYNKKAGGDIITCSSCGNKAKMLPSGLITKASDDDVVFDDLHKWTNWERDLTDEQISKEDFLFELDAELYKVFDPIDFAHTGNGKIYITGSQIIYKGTDCPSSEGIPYHKGKVRKGYKDRVLKEDSDPVEHCFEIKTMKGIVAKLGKCFEIYDSKGELFRFHVEGNKVYKVLQIVSLHGKKQN
ncbi:MAG: 1-acyl-sn-glycerol-3-phosphate acyltransferase [Clostridia bacterium]|nr:1-acyl-sn-glycerol-3-phosphate acyltransferase [Clostridia bacterium]